VKRRRRRLRCAPITASAAKIHNTAPHVSRVIFESLRSYVDARVIFGKTRHFLTAHACRPWKKRGIQSDDDSLPLRHPTATISGDFASYGRTSRCDIFELQRCRHEEYRDASASRFPLLHSIHDAVWQSVAIRGLGNPGGNPGTSIFGADCSVIWAGGEAICGGQGARTPVTRRNGWRLQCITGDVRFLSARSSETIALAY
jgi:hypothetical protein